MVFIAFHSDDSDNHNSSHPIISCFFSSNKAKQISEKWNCILWLKRQTTAKYLVIKYYHERRADIVSIESADQRVSQSNRTMTSAIESMRTRGSSIKTYHKVWSATDVRLSLCLAAVQDTIIHRRQQTRPSLLQTFNPLILFTLA